MSGTVFEIRLPGDRTPRPAAIGTPVGDLFPGACPDGLPALGAVYNNEVVSLRAPVAMNGTLSPLSIRDREGWEIFRRTACMLLEMAARRAWPEKRLRIRHSLGAGVFFTLAPGFRDPAKPVTAAQMRVLERTLRAIVAADHPIRPVTCGYEEAVAEFAAAARHDVVGLLRHVNTPLVLLQECDGFRWLRQGPAMPRTGLLSPFALVCHEGGGVLLLPTRKDPGKAAPLDPEPELMRVHREHDRRGELLGISCAGDLNAAVAEDRIGDVMQMAEALHDKSFGRIADRIAGLRPRPRIVLIAGPSSAGKTTSCKRLAIHLQTNGLRPVMLSTDDYFVPECEDPIGPDGKPDYEDIRAVDVASLRADLKALLAGRPARRRVFDFKAKVPVWPGDSLRLGPADILLLEGIHALNPVLSKGLPRGSSFRIYLSALTQLSIDDNTILSTTDNRLLRRIVRDHFFRGRSAKDTIDMWPSVRRGEEKWIFPFQDSADVSFNSALDYELAALRPFAETLLADIKPSDPEYGTARRLQGVLANFHPIPSAAVPGDSILREYIGGSFLKY